jgi:hypothetical protein
MALRIRHIAVLGLVLVAVMACGSLDTATNFTNNNNGNDTGPYWSPDGTKIAFSSGRDGNAEIYVMDVE